MLKILSAISAAVMLFCSAVQAQPTSTSDGKWEQMQVVPTPKFAEIWHKVINGRVCVASKNVDGEVRAVLLRGSILEKNLEGVWHTMEWVAPSFEVAQSRHMRLVAMYGNMAVGMEVADANYFFNECGDLPQL